MKKQKNKLYNLEIVFKKIYKLKINDILIEAGGIFFTNLLKSRLVDELHLFNSDINIGYKGKPFIVNNKLENYDFDQIMEKKFDNDTYQYLKFN
jgi:riboflavin biosynthesis pyrimidine reductase